MTVIAVSVKVGVGIEVDIGELSAAAVGITAISVAVAVLGHIINDVVRRHKPDNINNKEHTSLLFSVVTLSSFRVYGFEPYFCYPYNTTKTQFVKPKSN